MSAITTITTTATTATLTVEKYYSEFEHHDLAKINGKWHEMYYTKEDWDYHNHQVPTPSPTLVTIADKKYLAYIQPIEYGRGAFKFYDWQEPEEVLTFPNGKVIEVREKRTQPAYSNSVGDITIYWFNFDLETKKLVSFWTGSCWRSDGDIYPSMIESLKEKFGQID